MSEMKYKHTERCGQIGRQTDRCQHGIFNVYYELLLFLKFSECFPKVSLKVMKFNNLDFLHSQYRLKLDIKKMNFLY